MFPSNQNINNINDDDDEFNRDFDYSDGIFPKDVPMFVQQEQQQEYSTMINYDIDNMNMVANYNYNSNFAHHDHQYIIDQNQDHQTNSSSVVLDFNNPTGAGAGAGSSWPNQPELELPAAAAAAAAVGGAMEMNKVKKLSHKEIERQRRQEMAKLHSSLRELLPIQYIKGKRSVAEHMSEAVNYIGHLQNRIKELGKKKDKMMIKMQQQQQQQQQDNNSSSNVVNNIIISVNPCYNGVQVLISCDDQDDVLLSKVMEALIEEGHDIITSVSNLVNHKLLHNIKTQVNDPNSEIDLFMLQQKLSFVINSN